MYKIISECPVCHGELKASRLQCSGCGTVIENDFALTKFDYLSQEDLYFVETFIKCRGSIKEVERELKISYPTVRAKLDGVIQKLGYQNPSEDEQDAQEKRQNDVLDALENGEITPEEALERLK